MLQILVTDTTIHHSWGIVSLRHDLLPGPVNLVESLGLLGQLLGDVATDEDSLEVDPPC